MTPWSRNKQHAENNKPKKQESTRMGLCGTPEGSCPSHLRKPRKPQLLRIDETGSVSYKPVSLYNHPSLWDCCSVGLRCYRPPFQTRPVTRSLETNKQTKMASESRLSLCTATNAHYHRCELFFFFNPKRNINLFFFFSEVYFLSKTKHAAYLMYAVRAERKPTKKYDACPGRDQRHNNAHRSSPPLHLFPASSRIIYLFANDTEEWLEKSPGVKAVHPCGWGKKRKKKKGL